MNRKLQQAWTWCLGASVCLIAWPAFGGDRVILVDGSYAPGPNGQVDELIDRRLAEADGLLGKISEESERSTVDNKADLQKALQGIQCGEGDTITVMLMGHGNNDRFVFSKSRGRDKHLSADELAEWLEAAAVNCNCKINVVLFACHSGSFMDNLLAKPHIKSVYTSCSARQTCGSALSRNRDATISDGGDWMQGFNKDLARVPAGTPIADALQIASESAKNETPEIFMMEETPQSWRRGTQTVLAHVESASRYKVSIEYHTPEFMRGKTQEFDPRKVPGFPSDLKACNWITFQGEFTTPDQPVIPQGEISAANPPRERITAHVVGIGGTTDQPYMIVHTLRPKWQFCKQQTLFLADPKLLQPGVEVCRIIEQEVTILDPNQTMRTDQPVTTVPYRITAIIHMEGSRNFMAGTIEGVVKEPAFVAGRRTIQFDPQDRDLLFGNRQLPDCTDLVVDLEINRFTEPFIAHNPRKPQRTNYDAPTTDAALYTPQASDVKINPSDGQIPRTTVPEISFTNVGKEPATVTTHAVIGRAANADSLREWLIDPVGEPPAALWRDQRISADVASAQTGKLSFKSWVVPNDGGEFWIGFTSATPGDVNPENNVRSMQFKVEPTLDADFSGRRQATVWTNPDAKTPVERQMHSAFEFTTMSGELANLRLLRTNIAATDGAQASPVLTIIDQTIAMVEAMRGSAGRQREAILQAGGNQDEEFRLLSNDAEVKALIDDSDVDANLLFSRYRLHIITAAREAPVELTIKGAAVMDAESGDPLPSFTFRLTVEQPNPTGLAQPPIVQTTLIKPDPKTGIAVFPPAQEGERVTGIALVGGHQRKSIVVEGLSDSEPLPLRLLSRTPAPIRLEGADDTVVIHVPRKSDQLAVGIDGDAATAPFTKLETTIRKSVAGAFDDEVIVELRSSGQVTLAPPNPAEKPRTIATYDITVRRKNGSIAPLTATQVQAAVNAVRAEVPEVRFIEPALPRDAKAELPNDPHYHARGTWGKEYPDQWALKRIGFGDADGQQPAWDKVDRVQAKPCIVAVIGTGVDWTHPELWGQMWANMKEIPYNGLDDDGNGFADDIFGWNFREQNADVRDPGGHDTHIAGVIAARGDNGRGIVGINPYARIMALRVADFVGQANSIDISRAVFYAVEHGARVINISYGGKQPSQVEQAAIDYARGKGVLVVVASGNEGSDATGLALSGIPNALTVAGTDSDNKRATFSNWGRPVDLAAPAMDILGLRSQNTDFLQYTGGNERYEPGLAIVGQQRELYRASGTSFAAPFVSGVASLLFSARPELTDKQVERMLLQSCRDIETPGWDQYTGFGLIDARAALVADPEYYLTARIDRVAPARMGNDTVVDVQGQAEGSEFSGRWLQVGFGDAPADGAWKTIAYSDKPAEKGGLGTIPMKSFDKPGKWTVRILIQDKRKTVREARAILNLTP